ncbi:hypothetical protein GA0116948_104222 [Chitinophaga costaii]|uniref:Uncharacterized protein n=1 Tax=Chitinophaga costaii TaxID=1335309 RepID=A0A1C4CNT9_9BACT|nr:hypothetical protein GA0116948_104222 [Chitinophaga costaii]
MPIGYLLSVILEMKSNSRYLASARIPYTSRTPSLPLWMDHSLFISHPIYLRKGSKHFFNHSYRYCFQLNSYKLSMKSEYNMTFR